ncbi:MAG: MtaA/CmuA family methyltransferase [Clostridia bacterium]|nr:MtaA/CmuA family methyltransferase [Clostridia bacterium]
MTPKQRVFAHLNNTLSGGHDPNTAQANTGQKIRPALINPVSAALAESAARLGLAFNECHTNPAKAAALACYAHEELGFDSIMPYFSVVLEAAALGAPINWGSDTMMPTQRGTLYNAPEEVAIPLDFLTRPPTKALLETLALCAQRCPDALLLGKVMGPWTLCLHCHGMENTLIGTVDEPEQLSAMLTALCEISRVFIRAQLEAGADMVTVADHVTRNLVSPLVYEKFVLPLHQSLCAEFPGKLILHCCGNTEDRVGLFARAGFALYHFESANNPAVMRRLAGDMPLTGCVNNPTVLLKGTPKDVQDQCREILAAGINMLSPECAVPLTAPEANLRAMGQLLIVH